MVVGAYHKGGSETKIFTACTLEPLVFGIPLPLVDEDEDDIFLYILAAIILAFAAFSMG